jgi:hypothetical protein
VTGPGLPPDPDMPPDPDLPSESGAGRTATAPPDDGGARMARLEARVAAAVWTLPFAVGLALSLALPWASCPGCAGPTTFTAWSLPDSDAIGVSTGAEYGLCSIGALAALALTVVALITVRPGVATAAALMAAATTALGAYAITTVAGHGLNLEAGVPTTVACGVVLTVTLAYARSRLASGTRWRNLES